ncbi:ParB/RepB/Spo0J family partition protein [Actinacidiphila bryophytorum]|uniref:Chromosome-partitioning protein ParB n=1 Tax=Actinacidiphila bryophytorum TaxID=1436133 RepID=A0A9W4MIP6_9ACTN|nr:ParB/RepB/Spo0J family partition protein [Actinacidiphila bryophytorum]MBM9437315.1 ParB/RepB/Spo0J family partition protein [Actinacidiphila bryophytorum]MBN6543367.1 ParB/RepB/Spo0J family partition protein [Actinacidiphila bryophytorum]CAG7651580.1 putative chromosome-partitioning protein ParB [Actinacidiphila bryophytorum]
MSDRRRGLGRGLGALIPAAPQATNPASGTAPSLVPDRGVAAAKVAGLVDRRPADSAPPVVEIPVSRETEPDLSAVRVPVAGAYFAELELDAITPNPRQPREVFDEDALNELITSIKEVGLLQPVVVRQISTDRFELIMGERRWRACREAGLERIPAIVRATDDEKLLLDALLENLHRAQLNPLEEAAAYDQLLRDFSCTHEQLADRIGRSRSQVSNTLRLLKLPAPVQRRVAAGVISFGHARALLALDDSEAQDKLALRIVAEELSVRTVEEIVKLMNSEPKAAKKTAAPRAGRRVSPALTHLATRLSDRFDTRVKVDLGQKRGKIVVEFASIEDLERILGAMAPGEGKVLENRLDDEAEDDDE